MKEQIINHPYIASIVAVVIILVVSGLMYLGLRTKGKRKRTNSQIRGRGSSMLKQNIQKMVCNSVSSSFHIRKDNQEK